MVKLFAIALLASAGWAQTPEPARFFKLDFVLKEVEGARILSAHTFTMDVSTDASAPPSAIRSGAKVPIAINSGSPNAQFNYLDVGVNIECRNVKEATGGLSLNVSAEVSSVPPDAAGPAQPVVHQNRFSSAVSLPLQKSTVLFASDDLATKHQMRLELTATPIR